MDHDRFKLRSVRTPIITDIARHRVWMILTQGTIISISLVVTDRLNEITQTQC